MSILGFLVLMACFKFLFMSGSSNSGTTVVVDAKAARQNEYQRIMADKCPWA